MDHSGLMESSGDYGKSTESNTKCFNSITRWAILFAWSSLLVFITNAITYTYSSTKMKNFVRSIDRGQIENNRKLFEEEVLQAKVDLIRENQELQKKVDRLESKVMQLERAVVNMYQ